MALKWLKKPNELLKFVTRKVNVKSVKNWFK